MDDHDYGQGDIWGAGKCLTLSVLMQSMFDGMYRANLPRRYLFVSVANQDETSGAGFEKPACIVNAAQRLALSHLPDPATDETLDNGITIHYTNYIYGETDLAILESRKFKNQGGGDSLFGSDQEAWVKDWCTDQERLKVVLLQTPVARLATNITRKGSIVPRSDLDDDDIDGRAAKTIPGRDRFMEITKDCTQLFVSGDQHLGIAVTYDDYGISECASPAASNDVYWRLNTLQRGQTHTNEFEMKYTLHNVWNVKKSVYERLGTAGNSRFGGNAVMKRNRADGFLMVDLNGATATCSMHSYRTGPELIWDVTVPALNPALAMG